MVKTPIQVRFNDIDLAGHVHNGVYLTYFEQARMDFFHQKLVKGSWDWKKQSLILARNEVDYKKPIYLQDSITCETGLHSYGHKSITLWYKVKRGEELCASGLSVLVCYDYEKDQTINIPEPWMSVLVDLHLKGI